MGWNASWEGDMTSPYGGDDSEPVYHASPTISVKSRSSSPSKRKEKSRKNRKKFTEIVGFGTNNRHVKMYALQVNMHPRKWLIFREYSDFLQLREDMKVEGATVLRRLPPNRESTDRLHPTFQEEQQAQLVEFLNDLISEKSIAASRELRGFLEIENHQKIATITGYLKQSGGKEIYSVQVNVSSRSWVVSRSYDSFVRLSTTLCNEGHLIEKELPAELNFFERMRERYFEEQQRLLQKFLDDALRCTSLDKSEGLQEFLEIDTMEPSATILHFLQDENTGTYTIEVFVPPEKWTIQRCYTDFTKLVDALKLERITAPFMELPADITISDHERPSKDKIRKKLDLFQQFLNVLVFSSRLDSSTALRDFLEVKVEPLSSILLSENSERSMSKVMKANEQLRAVQDAQNEVEAHLVAARLAKQEAEMELCAIRAAKVAAEAEIQKTKALAEDTLLQAMQMKAEAEAQLRAVIQTQSVDDADSLHARTPGQGVPQRKIYRAPEQGALEKTGRVIQLQQTPDRKLRSDSFIKATTEGEPSGRVQEVDGIKAMLDRVGDFPCAPLCFYCRSPCYRMGDFSGMFYELTDGTHCHVECFNTSMVAIVKVDHSSVVDFSKSVMFCPHCKEVVIRVRGKFSGGYYKLESSSEVHEECWEQFRLSMAQKCVHCKEPVALIDGLFNGIYYVVDQGSVHWECWDAHRRASSPACETCKEPCCKIGRFSGMICELDDGKKFHVECFDSQTSPESTQVDAQFYAALQEATVQVPYK